MSVLEKSGRRMTSRLSSLNSRPRREPVPRSRPGHIFPATISDPDCQSVQGGTVVAVAPREKDFGELAQTSGWKSKAPDPAQWVWTDDYSNIVGAVIRKLTNDGDRIDNRRGYFRLEDRGFRSRRPSPPPFPSVNSIPARCKANRIALAASSETNLRSFSKSTTVDKPKLAARASCDWVMPRSARAARHWAGVIERSIIFVDNVLGCSYQ
jgi:hypothetical protein